uniref:CD209 antigen-like protein C isoform X3 n=1 Tax=Centroberyx gerrardi TaxID=166262 RepID=UPI003AAF7558
MSEDLYAMVDMTKKVRHKGERDKRIEERGDWEERLVDIYVSAASLRGHDPGLGTQQAVIQDIGGGQHGDMMVIKEKNNLQSSYHNLTKERNDSQKKPCEETEEERCPHSWLTFGSSCYYISSKRRSWDQSRQACLQREADLVIINSREEQDFLSQFAVAAWVGMTDRDEEGIWTWVDGTPVISDRLQWAPGQPDDTFGGEDCGDIRVMPNFIGLNDYNCSAITSWICEKTLS